MNGEDKNAIRDGPDGLARLDLSIRTSNALYLANVCTLSHLASLKEWELLRIKGIGQKSLKELREAAVTHGITDACFLMKTPGERRTCVDSAGPVGLHFIREADGIRWQGRVLARIPESSSWFVELYSWVTGEPSVLKFVELDESYAFYKDRDAWLCDCERMYRE